MKFEFKPLMVRKIHYGDTLVSRYIIMKKKQIKIRMSNKVLIAGMALDVISDYEFSTFSFHLKIWKRQSE